MMPPASNSDIAGQANSNYRKAFKPNLNVNTQSQNSGTGSLNDTSPVGHNGQYGNSGFGGGIKSAALRETSSYEPEKRSPNIPRR